MLYSKQTHLQICPSFKLSFSFWTHVILHFVIDLYISNCYNTIEIILNCLVKEKHYISYKRDKNDATTKTIAQFILQNV